MPRLALLCGRYEGVDERLVRAEVDEELSIGDYVLSGGELAAAVVVDAVARLQDGVLNDAGSAEQDSFEDGLLDCPHYSHPVEHAYGTVPEVLRSGNHAAIARWRRQQAPGPDPATSPGPAGRPGAVQGRPEAAGRLAPGARRGQSRRVARSRQSGYNAGFLRAVPPGLDPITITCGAILRLHRPELSTTTRPPEHIESVTMSKLNKSIVAEFESAQITRELPKFSQGDTVVVNVKVKEGNRERVQAYEGVVIAIKNAGLNSAFTVRKISHGYGVERVFQNHSAIIDSVEVKRRGKVRAGKLYYLRGLEGKAARIKEDLAAVAKAKAEKAAG